MKIENEKQQNVLPKKSYKPFPRQKQNGLFLI